MHAIIYKLSLPLRLFGQSPKEEVVVRQTIRFLCFEERGYSCRDLVKPDPPISISQRF